MTDSEKTIPTTMLITGATGFIGARLATLALVRGYSVATLTRSDWDGSPAVPIEQRHFGNLPQLIPEEALQEIDVVVHCAASVETAEATDAVNIEGTIRLAHMAREAGVKTFIFLSSQSAKPDAISAYGKTKYAAERALLEMDGLNVIILRPGLVTGPGSRGLFQRVSNMVEKLPVVPLLGGGKSIVQPIHVDELCEGIFRCAEAAPSLHQRILNLGHPQGVSLAEFLQTISIVRRGRRRLMLPIPLWPVETAVRFTEALGIPLPINSNNLKGLKVVEKMETAGDLAYLNLALRPLEEMVGDEVSTVEVAIPLKHRPVRVLLVGAGRIGIVHALTLSRLKGVVLCGVVDPNRRATGMLKGMGLSFKVFPTLDEALNQTSPDAVVIATPPSTHLVLARACLQRGTAVLIEKPLAVQKKQLRDYELLAQEFPKLPIQVGYVLPRNPQVAASLDMLRSGDFGKVTGFTGLTLLSLIQQPNLKRWEVNKSISGGGALINAGGHVLSMISAAFGDPLTIEGQTLKLHSSEVEDSIALNFGYGEFRGQHYCSWSINGYPRQENRLIVWTDRGRLILTPGVCFFVSNDEQIDISHSLDFAVGFNLAPDYGGAGFSNELNDLKESVVSGRVAPMDLGKAIHVERLLFKAYDVSRETKSFEAGDGPSAPTSSPGTPALLGEAVVDATSPKTVRRVLDLRDLRVEDCVRFVGRNSANDVWSEYLLTPAQLSRLPSQSLGDLRLRVTVPDFLNQSRLLSNGRYAEVLKQMGGGGIVTAVRRALPVMAKERAPSFWVAAMGLLAGALHAIPSQFQGTLLLDVYLADLSLSLRRLDMLRQMLGTCRRMRPRARLGFHTNMVAEALHGLPLMRELVDEVSALTSPRALGTSEAFAAMRRADETGKLRLTAEVGVAPDIVHRVAFETPYSWAHGADALLIGIGAEKDLAEQRGKQIEQEWGKVFPGLGLPEGAV